MDRQRPFPFHDLEKPVSGTDMTGLIPTAVEDDEQAESYEELYPVHRQKPV